MTMFEKEMRVAVEFLPVVNAFISESILLFSNFFDAQERLYYVALSSAPPAQNAQRHFFSIDNEMVYWNFYLDFGPLNLGHLYRFCALMNHKLNDPKHKDKVIYYYSSSHPHRRANAAFLICAWSLLFLNRSPEEAFRPFKNYPAPFPPWHDATPSVCTFTLTILDTLRGLHKARECHFFDFSNFNIEEYEHYEQVENGDLNWYVEGKFIAFAGPHADKEFSPGGYYCLRPDDYIKYFKEKNVQLVVRLNKSYYDPKRFSNNGIEHMDMYFLDGSNPPEAILTKFIAKCEETPGAIAVHCKAGLGRTGTVIGCYIMKHYKFTAEEIIGWMRIVRPGSIIGPQQQFMREMQARMWREGDLFRASKQTLQSLTLANDAAMAKLSGSASQLSVNSGNSGAGSTGSAKGNNVSTSSTSTPKGSSSNLLSLSHSNSRGSGLNGLSGGTPSAPSNSAPTTPQLSRKLNGMTVASGGYGGATAINTTSSGSQRSSPYGTRQTPLRSSHLGSPDSSLHPNGTGSEKISGSSKSSTPSNASAVISGYFNKSNSSSANANSPFSAVGNSTVPVEGDEADSAATTQGDYLRIRRQQHIITEGHDQGVGCSLSESLSNATTPSSKLSSADMSFSSQKLMSGTAKSNSTTPVSGSAAANSGSSKFGSFLSWNK